MGFVIGRLSPLSSHHRKHTSPQATRRLFQNCKDGAEKVPNHAIFSAQHVEWFTEVKAKLLKNAIEAELRMLK